MQLKVFISSRLKELEEERTAVEKAVSELWIHENLPFTVWRWESAKEIPSGKHPDKVQSKGVRDSDIYVLIIGSEYGDFEYEQSKTHREYNTACSELEKDCILIYIKEVGRREEKLEKWIDEIKNKHTFKPFKNPHQLKDLVKTRLRDLWNKGKWKASMPTIQSVLRKGETFEGDFFKKEPEWIDFEEGYVVERKEVDEIIKKLENNNIQLVLGEPASGKSVILKNIGFKLANENKDVYIVEIKKQSSDEVKRYFDNLSKINAEKTVFIVDDAHLLPADCEILVREFKNRNLKAKLIIGSRPTREIRGEHPKEPSEFEYLIKTYMHAEDVTEEIIKGFLKKKHHFSDERINTVSENLEEYKKDLWHLSWALKAYNPEKNSVEEVEIYKKIRDSIRDIKLGKDESGNYKYLNAEDIFLPLSVFYRFEIPIERDFLEDQLAIEEEKINELIGLSEITQIEEAERNQMLTLIHSSIAESYFKTYQVYPVLGKRIKKEILQKDEDLEYCLFHKYISSSDPRNAIDVVIHLGGYYWFYNKKGGKTLLKKLVEDKEIEKSIKKGIKKEEDIERVVSCVRNIADVSEEVALKLVDAVSARIEKEEDVEKIGSFVRYTGWANEELALNLFDCIVDILSLKIEKEEDIGKIRSCMWDIAEVSEKMGLELGNRINIEVLSAKIEKEEDIGRIRSCAIAICGANKEVGLKLANCINVESLSSKIEKEEDIKKIVLCVNGIAYASEEVALKLFDAVSARIEKEEDIWKIGWCMKEEIAYEASEEVASKLFDAVSSRMEKEEDIVTIGRLMKKIADEDKKVGLELVNRIGIDILATKIEKEKAIWKIGWCIGGIRWAREEVAQEIVNRLNPKLREELQERGWLK